MGRYLKDPSTAVGYALRLPAVSDTGPTPANLSDGLIRFNTDTARPQYWYNGSWLDLANVGNTQIDIQEEIGDGVATDFVMDTAVANATDVMVFIGGVYQQPIVNYTIAGNEIRFQSAPPAPTVSNPNKVVIIYNLNNNDAG
jgi:hypothetical protein